MIQDNIQLILKNVFAASPHDCKYVMFLDLNEPKQWDYTKNGGY